jgi:competence protein ComEA
VTLGPGPVAVVAVMVAAGLAVTAWLVVRADSHPVAPTAPAEEASAAALATPTGPAPSGEADAEGAAVTVDVAGRVRRPGIAVLDAGARVVDAIRAAGGARRGVDLTGLNLARVLVDGEQVLVGVPAPAAAPTTSDVPGAPTGVLVDLNLATQAELEALPEVGPVTAQAILAWRDEHGTFTSVSELLEVDGIGEATLETLTPFVTV